MKFEIYADASGSFRWRLVSSNGQNVASSGESLREQGQRPPGGGERKRQRRQGRGRGGLREQATD